MQKTSIGNKLNSKMKQHWIVNWKIYFWLRYSLVVWCCYFFFVCVVVVFTLFSKRVTSISCVQNYLYIVESQNANRETRATNVKRPLKRRISRRLRCTASAAAEVAFSLYTYTHTCTGPHTHILIGMVYTCARFCLVGFI